MASQNYLQITIPKENADNIRVLPEVEAQRPQWLWAAALGADNGLVSIASLLMGVGAVTHDVKAMFFTGFAGLVASACGMAIGEFVSVLNRENRMAEVSGQTEEDVEEILPTPFKAAMAAALVFLLGAIVPLLAAAFITDCMIRVVVVVAATTSALVAFGCSGAVMGRSRVVVKSCARVVVGGWMAMAIAGGLESGGLAFILFP